MASVNVRNLERIQETEGRGGPGKFGALVLASLGGAALVVTAVTMSPRSAPAPAATPDPLAALVASARADGDAPERLRPEDVKFPDLLSDHADRTTALAAVKDERGRLIGTDVTAPGASAAPLPAADRLPVVPLPVGDLLTSTPVTREPRDPLTALAARVTRADGAEPVPPGLDGGWQIQVASFKDKEDADGLVAELRGRGYAAFRQAAYVPNRGLWHRVRIGPFDDKWTATRFAGEFASKERMTPFVVDPEKARKQAEASGSRVAVASPED